MIRAARDMPFVIEDYFVLFYPGREDTVERIRYCGGFCLTWIEILVYVQLYTCHGERRLLVLGSCLIFSIHPDQYALLV